jgi:hypothetical protein
MGWPISRCRLRELLTGSGSVAVARTGLDNSAPADDGTLNALRAIGRLDRPLRG